MATIDLTQYDGLLSPRRFRKALDRHLEQLADDGAETARRNARHRFRGGGGAIERSIQGRRLKSRVTPGLALKAGGKDARHAAIQDGGGTVKGKPWLRIPLPRALVGGRDRYPGSLRAQAPRKFYAARSKAGNLLLFDRATNAPWYVLKRSVKVRGTRYLLDAIEDTSRELVASTDRLVLDTLGAL